MTDMNRTTDPKKKGMTFNWGYGITGVYLVFVLGILYMVWRTTQISVDLVTPDYYAQELKYQDKIDASKRSAALSGPVTYEVKGQVLDIRFPKEFEGKAITGEVLVYYPADSRKDVRVPVKAIDNGMSIPLDVHNTGMHILQVSWQDGQTRYYFEGNLDIH
jgi:nitrogen fixation protein FixH